MDVFEVIEKRRSIRKFKHEPVATEHLRKILEAGRLAPSGGNRQPCYFMVVRDLDKEGGIRSKQVGGESKAPFQCRYNNCLGK